MICRIEKLSELVGETCRHDGCSAKQVVKYNIIGCCIVIQDYVNMAIALLGNHLINFVAKPVDGYMKIICSLPLH